MEGCHPPYGSISKGGQVFFLLISFIFTDQDRMCHPEFHFRITSEVCSGFHLFSWLVPPTTVSFWPCIFSKVISLAQKTNLKSELFIQLVSISLTPLIYHISSFSAGPKQSCCFQVSSKMNTHSNPCLSLKLSWLWSWRVLVVTKESSGLTHK